MVNVQKNADKITIELDQMEYDAFRSHLGNYLSMFAQVNSNMTLKDYIAFPMNKILTDIEEGFNKLENFEDYYSRMSKKLGKEWYKMI